MTSARGSFLDRYSYFLMTLLTAAVIVIGFSRTIEQNLIHPAIPRPGLLYFHAALFTSWLLFFIVQSALVRTGNARIHRTIGWFGVALGTLIPVVGVATTLTMTRFDLAMLKRTSAGTDMAIPLWDMIAFTSVFIPAVYFRKKPEIHRRLMVIATCALTAAGWGRFPEWLLPPVAFYAGVDFLILLGVIRDWIVNRKVNAVYLYVLPLFMAGQSLAMYLAVRKPVAWVNVTHALLG